jgi:HNH endonuclease
MTHNVTRVPFRQWHQIRLEVLARDEARCQYCAINTATHVDHVTPVRAGGTNEKENLVSACRGCNTRKGCKLFESFDHAKLWLTDPTHACPNPAHYTRVVQGKRVSLVDELREQARLEDDMTHGYMGTNYTKQEWLSIQRSKKRSAHK